jgi:hypothetical protein
MTRMVPYRKIKNFTQKCLKNSAGGPFGRLKGWLGLVWRLEHIGREKGI